MIQKYVHITQLARRAAAAARCNAADYHEVHQQHGLLPLANKPNVGL
jgi:hypothetical protein